MDLAADGRLEIRRSVTLDRKLPSVVAKQEKESIESQQFS